MITNSLKKIRIRIFRLCVNQNVTLLRSEEIGLTPTVESHVPD